ncbi:P pilus assembly chaperone PapD [Acinetobacter calcoaceticus]|uniref:P pilus assembly chaperone PapD n=1 Tax=Acinetobacter calcoaceticus TaxID=471 RepID=A0A4R1Y220_ACICA|nr:P pilus assembly chaperone PapD [Acinetobacter calcoaceticus]
MMHMKLSKKLIFSMTLMATLTVQHVSAAIALDRTRVVFDGDQQAYSLSISNKNESLPYLAQAWVEDADAKKIQGPLLTVPPLQRVEPGQQSQVKIQALPVIRQLPQDRETLYYFNLREIPPKSDKPNTLQIALQTRIKLFYRPAALKVSQDATPWQEQITLEKQNDQYLIKNPTAYFVTIVDGSASKDIAGPANFDPLMVAPFSEGLLKASAASLGNQPVLTYVNDYGARPQLSFHCSQGQCNVVPEKE